MVSKRKRLRVEASNLYPTVHIGKEGITENLVTELKAQLKKRKMIKIKILGSILEKVNRNDLAKVITEKTNSVLVELKGNTIVVYKS